MHFLTIMALSIEPTKTAVPAQAVLPTAFGTFNIYAFVDPKDGSEHALLTGGDMASAEAPLVRIHSECLTGDAFGSLKCDCGDQLRAAMQIMADAGGGVLVYLAQEGRDIGLLNKMRAYALQDSGMDTVDANHALGFDTDERLFLPAVRILQSLGITKVRLLTNNPDKISQIRLNGHKKFLKGYDLKNRANILIEKINNI